MVSHACGAGPCSRNGACEARVQLLQQRRQYYFIGGAGDNVRIHKAREDLIWQ